jgi:hypothetical protein
MFYSKEWFLVCVHKAIQTQDCAEEGREFNLFLPDNKSLLNPNSGHKGAY